MMEDSRIEELRNVIKRSRRIVFFGGAGVSTASGIPDFRSEDGLYSVSIGEQNTDRADTQNDDHIAAQNVDRAGSLNTDQAGTQNTDRADTLNTDQTGAQNTDRTVNRNAYSAAGLSPETILSATYFALHTAEFYDFYRRYMVHPDAEPNAVHRYLYKLEKQDKLRGIVTQNIDGLHKKAGNKRVYELHGSIYENYCTDCEASYPLERIMKSSGVPRCDKCGGIIKPWVVLYGEIPDKYTGIGACREISGADTLIVAGTSLSVEPAASYLEYFSGKNLIVINKTPTPADDKATLLIHDDVAAVFSRLLSL